MTSDQVPPPPRSGLSLYANLLDGDAPGTISGAPVTYNQHNEASHDQDDAAKKQQALAASLRFQPTKRPQLAAQKAKAKAIANRLAQHVTSTAPSQPSEPKTERTAETLPVQATGPKSTAADWIATISEDEDANAYYASTRQKRKKRKKKKEQVEFQQDWDDIYDPSRPNNYEEYKNSEEKIREVREWKDLLYRHRMSRRRSSDYDSNRSDYKPMNAQFAPPPAMSFAPPAHFDNNEVRDVGEEDHGDYIPPPPPNPASLVNDAFGEDAYLRRLRMSQPGNSQIPPPPPSPPPPPPPLAAEPSAPPPGQINRAPIRYSLPPAPADIPASEAELNAKLAADVEMQGAGDDESGTQPRSNRPGQAGFAERLLMKYGWTKGSGLGASGTGITNALYVKADKRKKKSDAEGGGFVTPATTGKILGGKKSNEADKEEGKFGAMSEVIRLDDMLHGIDVQAELGRTDDGGGGLMQEIGEECGEKYGSVERVYIHTADAGDAVVFVKFVNQLSALRAVNALEGRIFNGNQIRARFWDKDRFDSGMYEQLPGSRSNVA